MFIQSTEAQFVNRAAEFGINIQNPNAEYSSGTSFADFNGDGWDDISLMTFEGARFYLNQEGLGFEEIDLGILSDISLDLNMALWVDFDNDGDKDLFVSAESDSVYLFRNEGDLELVDVTAELGLSGLNTANYGAAWGDINNDGKLDLYLCRYHFNFQTGYQYENRLFLQQANGSFIDISMSAGVNNGSNPSFQPIFWDYDEDGWQDIFIINDLLAAHNTLYRNNGNNTFTDVTAAAGLYQNYNAMSATVGDYDNDQDMDLFVSNGSAGNYLYQNNGNAVFTNVGLESGVISYSNCWGGIWIDHNNDSYQDLYVASAPLNTTLNTMNFFFENNGDGTFDNKTTALGMGSDVDNLYAVCQSDFNKDGLEDILISPGNSTAKLYVNENTADASNHWISTSFEGRMSNRDAIGTRFKVYCGDDVYTRYTHCGEGFISQHSTNKHIGIGSHSSVDSLIIQWPRGVVETYYDISVDDFHHFVEGDTWAIQWPENEFVSVCTGNSILLEIEQAEFSSILWSNGSDEFSQQVSQSGDYSAELTHPNGIVIYTDTLHFEVNQPAVVEFEVNSPSCPNFEDGSITLTASTVEVDQITWINNGTGTSITGLDAGMYFYDGTDINGCVFGGDITLVNPFAPNISLESKGVLCFGASTGSATLTISPPEDVISVLWSNDSESLTIEGLPIGQYDYTITTVPNCIYEGSVQINGPEEPTGSIIATQSSNQECPNDWFLAYEVDGLTDPISTSWELITPGEDPLFIDDSETWDCFNNGTVDLLLTDDNGCQLSFSTELDIIIGLDELDARAPVIYPNPGNGLFKIDFPSSKYRVLVHDTNGKMVFDQTIESDLIDLRNLEAGIYFATIQLEGESHVLRLVIQ